MRVKAQILTDAGVYPIVVSDVIDQVGAYNAIMLGLDECQLFDGADEMEGKLIHISVKAILKHVIISDLEEDTPAVEPSENTRQEGPITFHAAITFLDQPWYVEGIRYVYQERPGKFCSIFLPQTIDSSPALQRADERTLASMLAGWRLNRGDTINDFTVLVPPGELSPQQAISYCQDYIKQLKTETPHVAEEMTAKAWYGHSRNAEQQE